MNFVYSLLLLPIILIAGVGYGSEPQTALWQKLLTQHVKPDGGVSYQGFQMDLAELDQFLQSYEAIKPETMTEKAKLASYINLYNALMIRNILRYTEAQKIDVGSPKFLGLKINEISIPGGNIWNGDYKIKLAGRDVHLDDIEHKLIRGQDPGGLKKWVVKKLDPRIHAAVNCAALSCPRVREIAYTEANVDKLLEENIREYVSASFQFAKISDSKLKANSIVYWYYGDFDQYGKDSELKGAGDYLSQFVDSKRSNAAWLVKHLRENFNDRSRFTLKLSSDFDFSYDWKINDERNKR